MELKFIADIHISPLTVEELKNKGDNIIRVTDKLPADEKEYRIKKLPVKEL